MMHVIINGVASPIHDPPNQWSVCDECEVFNRADPGHIVNWQSSPPTLCEWNKIIDVEEGLPGYYEVHVYAGTGDNLILGVPTLGYWIMVHLHKRTGGAGCYKTSEIYYLHDQAVPYDGSNFNLVVHWHSQEILDNPLPGDVGCEGQNSTVIVIS